METPVTILAALAVWTLLASLVTAGLYVWDKRAARLDRRRVPENTLLGWSLLGGWLGGWIASRRLRHKTQKRSFRVKFVACCVVHLAALIAGFVWWLGR